VSLLAQYNARVWINRAKCKGLAMAVLVQWEGYGGSKCDQNTYMHAWKQKNETIKHCKTKVEEEENEQSILYAFMKIAQ
jgi:hypothetical protein